MAVMGASQMELEKPTSTPVGDREKKQEKGKKSKKVDQEASPNRPESKKQVRASQEHADNHLRVMVIDDLFGSRQALKRILESASFEVVEAGDSKAAVRSLKLDAQFDVIVLDIRMPGVSGLDLCRILKAYVPTQDVPIIICSALSDSESISTARRRGAADYIVKPFRSDTICAKIGAALTEAAERKATRVKKKPSASKGS